MRGPALGGQVRRSKSCGGRAATTSKTGHAVDDGCGGIGERCQIQQGTEGPSVAAGSCFRGLHTHTAAGIIHIESRARRTFTLGDFFAIWGQPLNSTQVATAQGPVIAYVNGVRWSAGPGEIRLEAHDLVQLDVGDETPPNPFRFPAGL